MDEEGKLELSSTGILLSKDFFIIEKKMNEKVDKLM